MLCTRVQFSKCKQCFEILQQHSQWRTRTRCHPRCPVSIYSLQQRWWKSWWVLKPKHRKSLVRVTQSFHRSIDLFLLLDYFVVVPLSHESLVSVLMGFSPCLWNTISVPRKFTEVAENNVLPVGSKGNRDLNFLKLFSQIKIYLRETFQKICLLRNKPFKEKNPTKLKCQRLKWWVIWICRNDKLLNVFTHHP